MPYQFLYFDEALSDIQKAKLWYKEQKEGLEIEFAEAIEKSILNILRMPTAYAIRYQNIRIAHAKRFPYNIHFYINETTKIIIITAVVHNRRNN